MQKNLPNLGKNKDSHHGMCAMTCSRFPSSPSQCLDAQLWLDMTYKPGFFSSLFPVVRYVFFWEEQAKTISYSYQLQVPKAKFLANAAKKLGAHPAFILREDTQL